jgi:hypothetical protein
MRKFTNTILGQTLTKLYEEEEKLKPEAGDNLWKMDYHDTDNSTLGHTTTQAPGRSQVNQGNTGDLEPENNPESIGTIWKFKDADSALAGKSSLDNTYSNAGKSLV